MQVNRTEQKIIIKRTEAARLAHHLGQIMPLDPFCVKGAGYEIRTLYFDTLADRCCVEKEDGLQVHEKIRARIYGTDDRVIKLESKKKNGDRQVKRSLLIDRNTLEALCDGEYTPLLRRPEPLAGYFFKKLSAGMFPKAVVQYQRLSYCLDLNNIRITFDSDIRATEATFDLFQQPLQAHPILPQDLVILEVKYNNFLLGYIKNALREVRRSPTSFSKYFNGRSFYRSMI